MKWQELVATERYQRIASMEAGAVVLTYDDQEGLLWQYTKRNDDHDSMWAYLCGEKTTLVEIFDQPVCAVFTKDEWRKATATGTMQPDTHGRNRDD